MIKLGRKKNPMHLTHILGICHAADVATTMGKGVKLLPWRGPQKRSSHLWITYCKSGNIHGTLIFVNFAQNSASANSKSRDVCTFWTRRSCVLTMCVDAKLQMGNILENVWGLLCFFAAQLLVNVSLYDVRYLCNTNMSSEYLLSANLTTREYVFVAAKREKLFLRN